MDAVKFFKEKSRMCDSINVCSNCPLNKINNTSDVNCFDKGFEEEAVSIVEKWSTEHPIKTRKSEFLKMFPNVKLENNVIAIHPCKIDTRIKNSCIRFGSCLNCQREYWLQEVE